MTKKTYTDEYFIKIPILVFEKNNMNDVEKLQDLGIQVKEEDLNLEESYMYCRKDDIRCFRPEYSEVYDEISVVTIQNNAEVTDIHALVTVKKLIELLNK